MTEQHANPEDFDLYALDALDGEEKQAFEAHLRTCPACRQQLAQARGRASLLGLTAAPIAPPPSVKSSLMQRIHAEGSLGSRQSSPSQADPQAGPVLAVPPRIRKKHWGLRFSLAFAAAAVILALAVSWLWKQNQQRRQEIEQLRAQLDAAQSQASRDDAAMREFSAVMAAPDTSAITLQQQAGGPPGQAHVLYNARLGLVVYSGQISPAPADRSYQLWLVPTQGAPVSAGVLAANQQNGAVVVQLAPGVAAQAFAVTLEPLGGRPQPTGPKILVGALNS
jgi:anti-sigma-K factor RskA